MSHVMIYKFRGHYSGNARYEYTAPQIGASHECMLFLAQPSQEVMQGRALTECHNYGFIDVEFNSIGLLKPEVLESDQFKGFSGFYEEALQEGSSLLYYPNA